MTKQETVMEYLANKKVPVDVIKTAAKGVQKIRKEDALSYAKWILSKHKEAQK